MVWVWYILISITVGCLGNHPVVASIKLFVWQMSDWYRLSSRPIIFVQYRFWNWWPVSTNVYHFGKNIKKMSQDNLRWCEFHRIRYRVCDHLVVLTVHMHIKTIMVAEGCLQPCDTAILSNETLGIFGKKFWKSFQGFHSVYFLFFSHVLVHST